MSSIDSKEIDTHNPPRRRKQSKGEPPLMRIVLLGKSVSENSHVGNFILGRSALDSGAPLDVVERVGGRVKDRNIMLINSPILLRTNISDLQITQALRECVRLSDPGPHVIILILNPPCSPGDRERLEELRDSLSDCLFQHSLVISTREHTETSATLREVLQRCSDRHFSLQMNSSPEEILLMCEEIQRSNDGHLECVKHEVPGGVMLNLVVCGSDSTLKSSISEQIQQQKDVAIHGHLIRLLELPALMNSGLSRQEVMRETLRCVSLCHPGVHVFLFIIPHAPLDNEDKAEIEEMRRIFSSRINRHMLILIKQSSERQTGELDEETQAVLQSFGGRHHFIGPKTHVSTLMEKIEEMLEENRGDVYSTGTFLETQMEKLKYDQIKKKLNSLETHLLSQGSAESEDDLRIVLLGKTGVGKSATGNTILGRDSFKAEESFESVTSESQRESCELNGRRVTVIDTPGLFDTELSNEEIKREISHCISMMLPGPHVFLLLIPLGRFTKEEQESVKIIQETFGENSLRFTMVLFTRGDFLKDKTIEQCLGKPGSSIRKLTEVCGNRVHVFNNNQTGDRTQVHELLEKIDNMVKENRGSFYSCKMFREMERERQERQMKILVDRVREEEMKRHEEEKEKMKRMMEKEQQNQEKERKRREEKLKREVETHQREIRDKMKQEIEEMRKEKDKIKTEKHYLKTEYETEIDRMKIRFENERKKREEEYTEREEQYKKQLKEKEEKEREMREEMKRERETMKNEIEEIRQENINQKYKKEKLQLKFDTETERLMNRIENEREKHDKERERREEQYKREIQELEEQMREKMKREQEEREKPIQEEKKRKEEEDEERWREKQICDEQIQRLQEKHEDDLQKWTQGYEKEKEEMKKKNICSESDDSLQENKQPGQEKNNAETNSCAVIRKKTEAFQVPAPRAEENSKAVDLASFLNQLNKDLSQVEMDILKSLRAPLNRTDPATDLTKRLKEQEQLEKQMAAAQKDLQPLLSKDSIGPTSSTLPQKLRDAQNKQDSLAALIDLYKKKANASMVLERQLKKMNSTVSGFEKQLDDDAIPDKPNAIQSRTQDIQGLKRDVAGTQSEMQKLSKDLEALKKMCSSFQQGYQEYCPDIRRQEAEVKNLQSRYANINNQLNERERLLQEASTKHQDFRNVSQSLSSFLDNLPNNKINPKDDMSNISAKQNSQKRVIEDIQRKGDDMDRVVDFSKDLQNVLKEYEMNCDKYKSTLDDTTLTSAKRPNTSTLASTVAKKEKNITNHYTETAAASDQLLNQINLAKCIMAENVEKVNVVQQRQKDTDALQKELNEEIAKCADAENRLSTIKTRYLSLKNRRGKERVEEEILQYYRDPKLEASVKEFYKKIHEEALKRTKTQNEIEVLTRKITSLESQLKNTKPKLVTSEITEIEKDPQQDAESSRTLLENISKLRSELGVKEQEKAYLQTEMTILDQKKQTIKEKVVQKEVVKLEKHPEMLKAVRTFEMDISDEGERCKSLKSEISQIKNQIHFLERLIPTLEHKVVTKEVKRVEQDPGLISESKGLLTKLDEIKNENKSLMFELSNLQSHHIQIQQMKPKVEVKEIVNENFRVDPETEAEIKRLRRELQENSRQYSDFERQISFAKIELGALYAQKLKVEYKEVVQEVGKEKKSPENVREIQRLSDQVYSLQKTYSTLQDELIRLRKDRDQWKAEKSKVETKIIKKDVTTYIADPLLEKEADHLRRDVREETQKRKTIEEMVFDLQNKYIQLEQQKPEEKVVVQEVVRLQKDPRQLFDHERLGRSLDEEVKNRRKMELEVQQMRALIEDKEITIRNSEERQRKIQLETELRQIKSRIIELETAPIEENIVIEEVLKVERDPKLDKLSGLRTDMDKERSDIMSLERDIRKLTLEIEILQREKSVEKTIYIEVIHVEKDQTVEAERSHIQEQLLKEKNTRQDLEDELHRLHEKLQRQATIRTTISLEETNLIHDRDNLQREKENLQRELKTLESERHNISISFHQQSRLMRERNQINKQRSIKMKSDVQRLEREILDEKDKIHKRDNIIRELKNSLWKEDSYDTHTKEKKNFTKISILDPDTGKEMSPYDAYMQGFLDRNQYIQLQELECDWEEITTVGPDGEISVLHDGKSGKQYSIKNALKEGRVTKYQLQEYKEGKMPVSEFALLVAGETRAQSYTGVTNQSTQQLNEEFPISGVHDVHTGSCLNVRSAMSQKMIDTNTSQKLLEAQAATGGIVDMSNGVRYSVHKAADRGLIEPSQLQQLLNAQKALTGVEDPVTKEHLSVGEAVQRGWMPKENAMRYMEAQFLTGGLINPNKAGRVSIVDAISSKMIDSTMMRELQEEINYAKELTDPITKEKINYKQALARCKTDRLSGLPVLPASSKDSI